MSTCSYTWEVWHLAYFYYLLIVIWNCQNQRKRVNSCNSKLTVAFRILYWRLGRMPCNTKIKIKKFPVHQLKRPQVIQARVFNGISYALITAKTQVKFLLWNIWFLTNYLWIEVHVLQLWQLLTTLIQTLSLYPVITQIHITTIERPTKLWSTR